MWSSGSFDLGGAQLAALVMANGRWWCRVCGCGSRLMLVAS